MIYTCHFRRLEGWDEEGETSERNEVKNKQRRRKNSKPTNKMVSFIFVVVVVWRWIGRPWLVLR
jgi:hypothetical protein